MASDFATELKAVCGRVAAYSSENEPIEDLKTLHSFVKNLREPETEDNRNSLLNTLPSLVTFILSNKKYSSVQSMSLASDIIDEVVLLFPHLCTSSRYLEAFRSCSDASAYLYEQVMQDTRGGPLGVPPEDMPDPLAEWRKTLTEDMKIDAIKVDPQYDKRVWAKAVINRLTAQGEFQVIFEYEKADLARTLTRDSHEIAPYNTKSKGDEWRRSLAKGSIVDVCDTVGIWYHSTIQDVVTSNTDSNEVLEVNVGYRVYEPNGEKCDASGTYRGWSSKFDEWMSAGSPRIMPFNSCARKTSVSQDKHNEEKIIDDSNDYLVTEEWAKFVTRPKKSDSILLVRSLNKANKHGIFDAFLEILNVSDPWPSFELIFSVIYYVGRASSLFHKLYAREYIPKFTSIVMKKLIDSPQANYRDFNKEKLDIVIYNIEILLKRVYSIESKNELIEDFNLEISLKSFQTPYLERKIQGLRGISDAISRARFIKEGASQNQELVSWVKSHNIIQEVFGPKGHFQLVQRSGEIVTLLSISGDLTREHLEFIWASAQKNDEDMRQSVYKMLGEINCSIKPEHLEMIVEFIEELPPTKLLRDDVLLVQEITKYAVRAEAAAKRACAFLWHAIIDNAGYPSSIIDLALDTYTGLMKSWELRKNRIPVMIDCLEKIKENKSVTLAIQIIKNLLNSFPISSSAADPMNKSEAIEILVNEHNLLDAFFENLVYFKIECQKIAEEIEGDITNVVVFDRVRYKEEVEERLSLLQTLVSGAYDITLSRKQMDTLWETFLKKSLCSAEREHYLKWLADATESQSQGKKVFDDSDIYSFFIEKVANIEDDYKDMQLEGFCVFRSYFLLVNVSLKKMQQNSKQSFFMSSSYYQSDSYPKDFEYQILVQPLELEGIRCLRKILIEVNSEYVLSQASELFHELYDNINYTKVDTSLGAIRQEYIEHCLGYIDSGDLRVKKRAMVILKNFMEECEKRGTGGLQPHNSMLKGDLHTLTFVNHISYYPYPSDVQKKIELKVYSNTTIWELRTMVGQHVKCLNDQFKISRTFSNKEIKDNENGKTLSELRIRLNESFTLQRRNSKIPRVSLLNENGGLTEDAAKIFGSWFAKFADKGDKMSHTGCAAFTSSCTGDTCQATDRSIQDLFATFDDDRDGLLTRDNFLSFYEKSCINKPITVWSNLSSHHYRGDLRKYDDGEEPVEIQSLPGYILMQRQDSYDILLNSLNIDELANDSWDLLIKLPTNPKIINQIKEIPEEFDWSTFLDSNCFYKLLYNLQVIEYYMQDIKLQDYVSQKEWKIKFITTHGFKRLFSILIDFQKSEGVFQKKCLAFVLNLVSVFVLAGFASLNPEIYAAVELVRKQSIEDVASESKQEKDEQDKDSKILNDLREEIIKHNLENQLIAVVDFSKLIKKLMEIMAGILSNNESEVEDKHIVESALELWVSCLMHNNSLIEAVYGFTDPIDLETFTCTALTNSKLYHVRSLFSKSLANVCQKVVYEECMPIPYFLNLLMRHIPSGKPEAEKDYSQFFEVLCKLLELDLHSPSQDYERLVASLMRSILEHPFTERRSSYLSDRVLVGLLSMVEILIRNNDDFKNLAYSNDFTQQLFLQILFPPQLDFSEMKYSLEYVQEQSHMMPPKAKCRDSRVAAYKLVVTLISGHSENLSVVLELINSLRSEITPVKSWNYSPLSDSRQGYAGIYNLGCICYQIAMLQQFFFIPQFRYSLLDVDDMQPPNPGPNDIDDNLLHQLQRMFGFLELTERQAYNPAAFCYSFKDFAGMPTNITIQQDAQEFLNMIFEKLETLLKDTKYRYLMQGIFGGKTVSQCTCKECGEVKEILEDFYNISLDVKHSKTISESLQRFISCDSISDYKCEKCDKKVDISKRNLIESVPNILIMHLQRIVFNFDTFANEKINSKLEFPNTVDLFPYTKAGQAAGAPAECIDYQYELTGIVVHKGTAEIGHYYSFIKTEPNKWFEFNDGTVKPFNPTRIEAECFGGSSDDDLSWMKSFKDNSRNAYMLVYEKKVKHDLKLQILEGDSTTSPRTDTRDFNTYNRTMPDPVYQAVMADNDKYMLQKNIYNSDFFVFLLDTINASLSAQVDISTTVLHFVFEVMCHSFYNKNLPDVMNALKKIFDMFPSNFELFIKAQLEDNLNTVTSLLLICTEKITREAIADFFAYCLIKLANLDFSENSDARLFMSNLLSIIPQDLSKHWTRFQQFWIFFRDFAMGGELQALYLLNSGAIAMFIDFYLAEKSPLLRPGEKRSSIGNKMWTPCFDPLVQTLAVLSRYCSATVTRQYELTDLDKKCLFDAGFYEKTLSNSYDCKSLGIIVQHFCHEDLNYSEAVGKILLKALNDRDLTDIQGLFDVISMFLTVDDSYVSHRIEWMLGFPVINKLLISEMSLPYFASASVTAIDEEIYSYPSTLELFNSWNGSDSILTLIWKYHKRWETFCLMYIKYLLRIFNLNSGLALWAKNLPPPTYQFSSFLHWVEDFVHKTRANSYSANKDEEGEEVIQGLLSLREKYGLRQEESYVIGKTVDKKVQGEFESGDALLRITEYRTEWLVSQPDGVLNAALPNKPLKSEQISGYTVEIPYKSMNIPANSEIDTDESANEVDGVPEPAADQTEFTQVRIEVLNKSSSPMRVRLLLNKRPGLNFLCPSSAITVEVLPQNSKDVLVLSKITPWLPWPEVDYKWEVCNKDYDRFNDDQYGDNSLQHYSDDVAVNVSDEDIRNPATQISCPGCTTFNDANATKCEVCETPLVKSEAS